MIRFREFLVETDTGKAKEMEELIVAACNGEEALDKFQPTKLKPEKEAKEAEKKKKSPAAAGGDSGGSRASGLIGILCDGAGGGSGERPSWRPSST